MKRSLILIFLAISYYGFAQVDGSLKTLTASGTNTYTITEALPASYDAKERFLVRFTNANTGAATLNRATLGAKAIQQAGAVALSSGDIKAGGTYLLSYNGTYYQIVGGGGSSPTEYGLACSDLISVLTSGTSKSYFRMPKAFTVTAVRASLLTAQTSGSIITIDINESGTTILSTKLTIDNNEATSQTAATAAVISDTAIADDAIITVDFDVVGTGGFGVIIWIIGY